MIRSLDHPKPSPGLLVVLPALLVWTQSALAAEAQLPSSSQADAHAMARHMSDDPFLWHVALDRLERQDGQEEAFHWDIEAWAGRERARVLIRTEGERVRGAEDTRQVELLGWWPVAAWWNGVIGVRHDDGDGPARSYAAMGVEGVMPGEIDVEATFWVGEGGRSIVGLTAETDVLITNRLILTPRLEAEARGRSDRDRGTGRGPSRFVGGLRLRYELHRQLAPYAGIEWRSLLGDTADLARERGEEVRDTRIVAGFRAWF